MHGVLCLPDGDPLFSSVPGKCGPAANSSKGLNTVFYYCLETYSHARLKTTKTKTPTELCRKSSGPNFLKLVTEINKSLGALLYVTNILVKTERGNLPCSQPEMAAQGNGLNNDT